MDIHLSCALQCDREAHQLEIEIGMYAIKSMGECIFQLSCRGWNRKNIVCYCDITAFLNKLWPTTQGNGV